MKALTLSSVVIASLCVAVPATAADSFTVDIVRTDGGGNLGAGQSFTYDIKGVLTNTDPNLSFSLSESPWITLSRTILEQGVDDDPANATQIAGQNLLVSYDRSQVVEDVNNFITAETERVICQSPLSRHLIPHFIRFDLNYSSGSAPDVVKTDLEKWISGLFPVDALESSDLQKIVSGRGAVSIQNPIDLIAVVHNPDRSVTAVRSQNSISTGRLSTYVPDVLNVKRNTG